MRPTALRPNNFALLHARTAAKGSAYNQIIYLSQKIHDFTIAKCQKFSNLLRLTDQAKFYQITLQFMAHSSKHFQIESFLQKVNENWHKYRSSQFKLLTESQGRPAIILAHSERLRDLEMAPRGMHAGKSPSEIMSHPVSWSTGSN